MVPSNDAFTSLDKPLALFDGTGHFLGDKTLTLTGNDIWDAGTEVNQLFGSAFVVGQNAGLGDTESLAVGLHPGFGSFDGQLEPNGHTFNVAEADVTKRGGFTFASITISEVPEPASWTLMLAAISLGGFAVSRRRRNGSQHTYAAKIVHDQRSGRVPARPPFFVLQRAYQRRHREGMPCWRGNSILRRITTTTTSLVIGLADALLVIVAYCASYRPDVSDWAALRCEVQIEAITNSSASAGARPSLRPLK